MALQTTYFLADVDGTLCVAARSTDWAEPRYVVHYWPTKLSTRELLRMLADEMEEPTADKLRASLTVHHTMPGEYRITAVNGRTVYGRWWTIALTEGGRTKSIKTAFEEVPVPRIGKGSKRTWENGRWYIVPPLGKPRTVDV